MTPREWSAMEAKQIKWQREVMHNHCTICWNRNGWVQCASCGYWGFVAPTQVRTTVLKRGGPAGQGS